MLLYIIFGWPIIFLWLDLCVLIIKYPTSQREIVAREIDPLTQQSFGSQQTESDVGCFRPLLKNGRVEEIGR